MKYFVVEIQKYADGTAAMLNWDFAEINQAWSQYHLVLSAAAVSQLPVHSAVIMNETGFCIENKTFEHEQPVEE